MKLERLLSCTGCWHPYLCPSGLCSSCHSVPRQFASCAAGIAKLDDANNAGGKFSDKCTLILTEGDSAKTLAISGLSVVGRDNYGVFPLRGKLLNVRDASATQVQMSPPCIQLYGR
jgi:DNA gyrase/topoisomerase IV subunit B